LSRRNISVAGRAAHSVIAFILIVRACSSLSRAASNLDHGMSVSMFQRTDSSCLKSSGYSMTLRRLKEGFASRIREIPDAPARMGHCNVN